MSFGTDVFAYSSSDWGLGYNGVKVTLNYFDGLPIPQNIPSAELQLCFKSLLKRANTTKEKAMADLLSFLQDDEKVYLFEDDMFILSWCQLYAKLISSDSKFIRTQAHQFSAGLIAAFGKRVSKYLKELVPMLLIGLFDVDAAVSRSCSDSLTHCFKDTNKVSSLWKLFTSEILNLVRQVILVETPTSISDERFYKKEEVSLRYNQLLVASIRTLTNLVSIEEINSQQMDVLHEILSEETLWNQLNLKDTKNLKAYQSLLHLMVQLRAKQLFRKNKEGLKASSRKLFQSLSACDSKTLMAVSSVVPDILKTLIEMNQYKDGKFWSYDKKSIDRLSGFLLLGPGISDPIYYSLVYQLSTETHILQPSEWFSIWIRFVDLESERRVLGRNGYKPLIGAWKYCLKYSTTLSNEEEVQKLYPAILKLIGTKDLKETPELVTELSVAHLDHSLLSNCVLDLLPSGHGDSRKELLTLSNTCLILSKDFDTMHNLSVEIMDAIQNPKNCAELPSHYGFVFFDNLIKTNNLDYTKDIESFLRELPRVVSEEFFQTPMDIMVDFSKSKFFDNLSSEQYFDDFIIVLTHFEETRKSLLAFLGQLSSDLVGKLADTSDSYQSFINDFVNNYQFDDDSIFKSNILTEALLLRLYDAARKQNFTEEFNHMCAELPKTSEAYTALLSNPDFVSDNIIRGDQISLPSNVHDDPKIARIVFDTILDKVSTKCLLNEESINEFVDHLHHNSLLTRLFIDLNLESTFSTDVNQIDTRTSLTSPLGLLPHILTATGNPSLADYLKVIRLSQVLDKILMKFPDEITTSHLIFLTRCYELTVDYNCLTDDQLAYFPNNNVYASFSRITFEEILSTFSGDQGNIVLNPLFDKNLPEATCFYNCKIIYRICLNSMDLISLSQFEKCLNGFEKVTRTITSETTASFSKKLYLFAIISATSKFSTVSEKITMIRNYLLSELVGIRFSDASSVRQFSYSMVLLDQLLKQDDDKFATSPLDPRRFNMALVSITNLMQSEIWYEESSNSMRLMVIQFVTRLNSLQDVLDSSEKLQDCSEQLLEDCIGFLELPDFQYFDELRYHVFALLNYLHSSISVSDKIDLDSIIDITFKNSTRDTTVSTAYTKPLSAFMKSLTSNETSIIIGKMFSEYFNPQISLAVMNVLLPALKQDIKEHQQDLVVEYELSKSTIRQAAPAEQSPSLEINFEIPPILLESLNETMPHDYLEYQEKKAFMRYLNYCHILIFYFEDISYDLRQHYVQQLKEKDLVNRLLEFLADQMMLSNTKYWENIDIKDVLTYPYSSDRGKSDPADECNMMMEFLMYHFFTIFGSLVGQWWNNIKNRAFKETVSNFVTRNISPTLISNELDETDEALNKFDKEELNLTVKVNRNNNEIKASYLIDEQKLEVAFKLPTNYPLQNVQVHGVSRVGITEQQWKSWIISTQRIISNMNGSVVDSLELLSKNVKLQFSGFEECAICYYILHAIDRKLPTKICPTCSNRFHGACLYKWFKSSGNNTCPMCRGEFNLRK
ncbi:unnamed protein product [Kluyveromyces dobzhanskii CBS 2104]|uniref:E3 ubiquitin-protein ligase listerin n=1 Tax=Kluyveromyces dobzhanskii CBS 2104 TaxID=1427455 RepID=A0A0A8L262_9SACH|nr:unnamed protein product [Kluyveromyces dobzhanskii CBS 2104]